MAKSKKKEEKTVDDLQGEINQSFINSIEAVSKSLKLSNERIHELEMIVDKIRGRMGI